MYIVMYLAVIVAANLLVTRFGPWMSIVNALVFIGFDLVARDKLHESWHNNHLVIKMTLLVLAGSILSFLLNRAVYSIAIASFVAFVLASVADTIVYSIAINRKWTWMQRSNGSNVAGAAVDSIVFPTIAFGAILPLIMLGQFAAKILGGFIWSYLLRKKDAEILPKT